MRPDSNTTPRRWLRRATALLAALAVSVAGAAETDGGGELVAELHRQLDIVLVAMALLGGVLLAQLLRRNRQLAQTRQALRAALAEHNPVFAALPDIVVLKDLDGTYLSCNDAFAELLERAPADVVGRRDSELFDVRLARRWRQAERAVAQSGLASDSEEWLALPQVSFTALMLFTRKPLYDAHDRLVGVISIARDVTARHRAEARLRERETYKRALLDNFPFPVWLKDTEGRFRSVNQPFADAVGAGNSQELVGKTDLDVWPKELARRYRAEDRQVMATRMRRNGEEQVEEHGERKWLETYKAPVIGEGGTLLGTVGFARDISERHRAEQALRDSEQRLRRLFAGHSAVMLFVDPDSGVIVDANDAAMEFYGHPRDALVGMSVAGINVASAEEIAAIRQKVVSGEQTHFEGRHRLASGEIRDVEVHSTAIDTGSQQLLLSIVHDITERRLAWRALEHERDLFSHGPVVVFSWAPREGWPIADVSHNCAGLLGFTRDELLNRDNRIPDFVHPDDQQRIDREIANHLAAGARHFEQSYRLRHRGGDYLWVHDFTQVVRGDDGEIECLRGYVLDNTTTKQLELALADEHQRLQHVIEGTGAGTWEWNVQTGEARFNERWAEIIGYRLNQLVPVSIDTWLAHAHPDDLARSEAALQRHFAGKTDFYECEIRMRHRDGHWVWVSDRGRVFEWTADGKPLWMYGTHTDATERKRAEQRLRDSEERLRVAGLASYDLLYEWHVADGTLRWFGDIDAQLGHPKGHIGHDIAAFLGLIHPDDRDTLSDAVERHKQSAKPIDCRFRVRQADGTYQRWHDKALPVRDPQGRLVKWIGVCTDVTERHVARQRRRLAEAVFQHAHEGIVVTDADVRIIDVNAAFTNITGYARDEVLGRNPRLLSSGHQDAAFYQDMWRSLEDDRYWCGEIWNRRKDGSLYAEQLAISAIHDEHGQLRHYVALFSDITQLKEQQNALERIAYFDALTELPNRVMLDDRLRRAMRHAERQGSMLALVYLDLDGFKAINDTYGHDVGDQVLVRVAGRLVEVLRSDDTLARLGGDEFVAILGELGDETDCVELLPRMLEAAARPLEVDGQRLAVSASLGVALYPQAEQLDPEQLLRQADQAMYQAKLAGKNRYHFFDTAQDQSIRGRIERVAAVRAALANDEFVLHYQPKVNMRSGDVVGVEALIRWPQADGGMLPPGEFLPLIGQSTLIAELDTWVMDRAFAQLEAWQADGLALTISVNVSAFHLQQPGFIDNLRDRLQAHPGVAPGDVVIEVLETEALMDLRHMSEVIRTAQALGVSFALDDFGTGFSSLDYLKNLPARQLKIDRSFVRDMLDDRDDLAILEGIVGLANAFSRELVAEGVESVEHGEILLRLGCEIAQGYGIGRPMAAEQLPAWIAAWRPDPSWSEQPVIARDDLPLMFAMVEHRAWVNALKSQLNGRELDVPELTESLCSFGRWLDGQGAARYGRHPGFADVHRLHHEIHGLAPRVLSLRDAGDEIAAQAQMDRVCELRNQLIATLKSLLQARTG